MSINCFVMFTSQKEREEMCSGIACFMFNSVFHLSTIVANTMPS